MNISPQQVVQAANAGIQLLNAPSTMIPGPLRAQLGVLEVVLDGIRQGQLAVAPVRQTPVESTPEKAPEVPAPKARVKRAKKSQAAAG